MAAGDVKASAMPQVAALALADGWAINQAGVDKYLTWQTLRDAIGDAIGNASTAAQAPAAATLTYIAGSNLVIPPAGLRLGTQFIWELFVSKTAAGVAARAFHVRLGTTATTADLAILTLTQTSLPTAVADVGRIRIIATVRGPLGAAAVMQGHHELVHNGNTAGLAALPIHSFDATSAGFNSAYVAGQQIGLSVTTGAAEVLTFTQVRSEAKQL
jgi:hypothetical protein